VRTLALPPMKTADFAEIVRRLKPLMAGKEIPGANLPFDERNKHGSDSDGPDVNVS